LIGEQLALVGDREALIPDREALIGQRKALVAKRPSLVTHRGAFVADRLILIDARARLDSVHFNGITAENLDSRDRRAKRHKNIFQPPTRNLREANRVTETRRLKNPGGAAGQIYLEKANEMTVICFKLSLYCLGSGNF
jgi:hypothetical protein